MSESAEIIKALKKTRRLILKGWTRGAYARDARRRAVPYDSKTAVCWCLMGAVDRAAGPVGDVEDALNQALGAYSLAGFNDSQKTKGPVLALIDKAIAAEKAKVSHAAE
jgi:hypothetical protein